MKVVVTGGLGVGKSTAARAAMRMLGWERPAGFATHWGGAGRGAEVLFCEAWGGERWTMARRIAGGGVDGAVPYELDVEFERRAAEWLAGARDGRPVAIDELGMIELGAREFVRAVEGVFCGGGPVLAVVQERALAGWKEAVPAMGGAVLVEVGVWNRDGVPELVARLLGG